MSILFRDSFDHYSYSDILTKWTSNMSPSNWSLTSAAGRRDTSGLRYSIASGYVGTNNSTIRKTLAPTTNTFICGFAFKRSSDTISTGIFSQLVGVWDSGTQQCYLRLNSDGTLSVSRGYNLSPALGTTTTVIAANEVYFIEWKVTIDNSVGATQVRINGSLAGGIDVSGIDTQASGTAQWTEFSLGVPYTGTFNTIVWDFDDLYVSDSSGNAPYNNFLGDIRIDVLRPTAEGSNSDFDPSTGSDNSATIDDITPSETDYNSSNTSGDVDTFIMSNVSFINETVYDVAVHLYTKKEDSGECSLAPVIRPIATNYVGTDINPSTTSAYFTQSYAVNPQTSAAWEESEINDTQIGYKRTT